MTISNKPPVSANSFMLNVERLIPDLVLDVLRSASSKLKTQPPKVFTARDFCNAIYNNVDIEKVAEIIGICCQLCSKAWKVLIFFCFSIRI